MRKQFIITVWSIVWLFVDISFAQVPTSERRLPASEEQQLERASLELAERSRQAPAADREKLRAELRALVERHFEARQLNRKQEIDELANRVVKLKAAFQKRQDSKADIVNQRLADLLDEDKDLKWDEGGSRSPTKIPTTVRPPQSNVPGGTVRSPSAAASAVLSPFLRPSIAILAKSPPLQVIERWQAFRRTEDALHDAQSEQERLKNQNPMSHSPTSKPTKFDRLLEQAVRELNALANYRTKLDASEAAAQTKLKQLEPELKATLEAELAAVTTGGPAPAPTRAAELRATVAQLRDEIRDVHSALELLNSLGKLRVNPTLVNVTATETPQANQQPVSVTQLGTIVPGLPDEILVLTNAAFVSPSKQVSIQVELPGGIGANTVKLSAQVIARDEKSDLALLRLEGRSTKLPFSYVAPLATTLRGERVALRTTAAQGLSPALVTLAEVTDSRYVDLSTDDDMPGSGVFNANGELLGIVPSAGANHDLKVVASVGSILALFEQAKRPTPIDPNRNFAAFDFSGDWHITLPAGFEFDSKIAKQQDGRWKLSEMRILSGVYRVVGDRLKVEAPVDERLTEFEWQIVSHDVLILKHSPDTGKIGSDYRGTLARRLVKESADATPRPAAAIAMTSSRPRDQLILLEVLGNNQFRFNGRFIQTRAELQAELDVLAKNPEYVTIVIAASSQSPAQQLDEVIAGCKQAEVTTLHITVATTQSAPPIGGQFDTSTLIQK